MAVKFCRVGAEMSQKSPSFQKLLAFSPASKPGHEDTGSVPSPRLWKSIQHCASWTQLSSVQSPASWGFGGNIGQDDSFLVWFPDSWFSYWGGSRSPDLSLISYLPHPPAWLGISASYGSSTGNLPLQPSQWFYKQLLHGMKSHPT